MSSGNSYLKWSSKDSAIFSLANYNDSHWTWDDDYDLLYDSNFTGICWARINFRIDKNHTDSIIGIDLKHYGASEVYLDGKLIRRNGVVSADAKKEKAMLNDRSLISLFIKDTAVHTLATRYSNTKYLEQFEKYGRLDVSISLAIGDAEDWSRARDLIEKSLIIICVLICGILLGLTLLHLFMFAFMHSKKFKLHQSILTFSMAAAFSLPAIYAWNSDPMLSIKISYYSGIFVMPFICLSVLTLLWNMFNTLKSKFYIFNLIVAALSVYTALIHSNWANVCNITLVMNVYIGSASIAVKSIRKKKEGGLILGAGVLSFTLFIILTIASVIFLGKMGHIENNTILIILILGLSASVLSMPLSTSIYLAYDFARTSLNLKNKITEVEELSKRTLEQEQEKKRILENQNQILEQQVAERTVEIRAQKDQLLLNNILIEEKNKEITDSINYALRIQNALLPHVNDITQLIPESFIVFKPKDIVSGDFYYYAPHATPNGEVKIVIGADCTGHGVPGAFMSMIGVEKIIDIIAEYANRVPNPGEILQKLNIEIREALKQDANSDGSKDGMDAAVCIIEKHQVLYAGANRPLIRITNQLELVEYKATKAAVGGYTPNDMIYETQTIEINKGDSFYIYSDGYADQFGGTLGKKMMTKRLKEKLLEVNTSPFASQSKEMDLFYDEWKGDYQQVDDVLLIGFKVS